MKIEKNWFKRDSEFKNYQIIIFSMILIFIIFIFSLFLFQFSENKLMGNYDLYQCIYNNAEANGFNQNPIMIDKIQDECICFRNYNYDNILEADCSNYNVKFDEEAYFKGLLRGCYNGCLEATSIIHNISKTSSFQEYNNTKMYPICVEYCIEVFWK